MLRIRVSLANASLPASQASIPVSSYSLELNCSLNLGLDSRCRLRFSRREMGPLCKFYLLRSAVAAGGALQSKALHREFYVLAAEALPFQPLLAPVSAPLSWARPFPLAMGSSFPIQSRYGCGTGRGFSSQSSARDSLPSSPGALAAEEDEQRREEEEAREADRLIEEALGPQGPKARHVAWAAVKAVRHVIPAGFKIRLQSRGGTMAPPVLGPGRRAAGLDVPPVVRADIFLQRDRASPLGPLRRRPGDLAIAGRSRVGADRRISPQTWPGAHPGHQARGTLVEGSRACKAMPITGRPDPAPQARHGEARADDAADRVLGQGSPKAPPGCLLGTRPPGLGAGPCGRRFPSRSAGVAGALVGLLLPPGGGRWAQDSRREASDRGGLAIWPVQPPQAAGIPSA